MSKPLDVMFWQRVFACSGMYPAASIDGRWGPKSQTASDAFDAFFAKTATDLGTFDPRTEAAIHSLLPVAQLKARQFMNTARDKFKAGTVKILGGSRTYEEQDSLYAQGRDAPGRIVTNAKGGFSNHNFAIAWDVGVFVGGEYYDGSDRDPARARAEEQTYIGLSMIEKANVIGLEWGGDWHGITDNPHYQLATGKNLGTIRTMFESGQPFV